MGNKSRLTLSSVPVTLLVAAALLAAIGFAALDAPPAAMAVPLPDYNEPNESFETATALASGVTGYGAIAPQTDKDYFYLDVPGTGAVSVKFAPGAPGRICNLFFQAQGSAAKTPLTWAKIYDDEGGFRSIGALGPGRFFVVVALGERRCRRARSRSRSRMRAEAPVAVAATVATASPMFRRAPTSTLRSRILPNRTWCQGMGTAASARTIW